MVSMTPSELVDRQILAYNARDLDAFCAFYADDICIHELGSGMLLVDGMSAFRDRYRQRFANPGLQAVILNRIAIGAFVTDHEQIRGITDGLTHAVVTYLVRDGLIRQVWMQHG